MSRRGYDGYRGRTGAQTAVRTVVGIVVVLLVLAVVGLLLGQRYIVYTDNGIRLEVPFLDREAAASTEVGDVSVEIVHRPDPDPETAGPEATAPVRAVLLTVEELENGGVHAAAAAGANTVILNMKGGDGRLGYVSALPLARDVSAPEDRVSALVQELHRADIRAVARVCCFRDDATGRNTEYALLTNSGYLWNYDEQGLCWMNPGLEPVRQYVAGIVGELARLGFDEILLEDWGYPTRGELGWIRRGESYDPDRLHEAVNGFVELAQQALEGTDAVLSLTVDAAVLEGSDTSGGRTPELPERLGCRVWLQGEDTQQLENLVSRTLFKLEQVVWPTQSYTENDRHLYLVP